MITLDEAIANHKKLKVSAESNNDMRGVFYNAEEHEQLAEWLEELKVLRLQNHLGRDEAHIAGRKEGYNKAIDDFASELENHSIYADIGKLDEVKMEWVSPVTRIKEVAEQLKEGVENE